MEMAGNAELIKDLLAPESATGDPEKITPIIKEVEPVPAPVKETVAKGKTVSPSSEEPPSDQEVLSNFLQSGEEETIDTPVVDKPEKEEPETSSSIFSSLSKELLKLGVFTTEEGDEETAISTPEEFLDRFNAEKKKGAIEVVDNFIGQFGEDYKNAFDAIFVKGVNPKDYFSVYNNIVSFAELNLVGEENENNQISVIRQALADQGFEAEDITTEIERLKNYGDLESVATKHHKVLVKKEAVKLQQLQEQSENELRQKNAFKNQYIQNVQNVLQEHLKTKEFDGIPINPKLASELQDFLLVDKWKTPSGETLTDFDRVILDLKRPENHSMKVKLALLIKILEKDPSLSTIQKTAASKKTDELFSEVARYAEKSSKPKESTQHNAWSFK